MDIASSLNFSNSVGSNSLHQSSNQPLKGRSFADDLFQKKDDDLDFSPQFLRKKKSFSKKTVRSKKNKKYQLTDQPQSVNGIKNLKLKNSLSEKNSTGPIGQSLPPNKSVVSQYGESEFSQKFNTDLSSDIFNEIKPMETQSIKNLVAEDVLNFKNQLDQKSQVESDISSLLSNKKEGLNLKSQLEVQKFWKPESLSQSQVELQGFPDDSYEILEGFYGSNAKNSFLNTEKTKSLQTLKESLREDIKSNKELESVFLEKYRSTDLQNSFLEENFLDLDFKNNLKEPELLNPQIVEAGNFSEFLDPVSTSALDKKIEDPTLISDVRDIVNHVKVFIKDGGGQMNMELTPHNLGQLHLKVVVKNGQIRVDIVTENAEAQKLLQEELGAMRSSLEDQNLNIDHIKVATLGDVKKDFSYTGQNSGEMEGENFLSPFSGGAFSGHFKGEKELGHGDRVNHFKKWEESSGKDEGVLSDQRVSRRNLNQGHSLYVVA